MLFKGVLLLFVWFFFLMKNELTEVKEVGSKHIEWVTIEKEHVGSHWASSCSHAVGYHSAAQFKLSEGSDMAPQP